MHNVAQLRRLRERFPRDLVVIGVHSAKFPSEGLTANIREAARRHGIQHPVVNDAGFQVWNEYAVRAWPTLVLIDPHGKIVHTESGEIEASEWIPRIESLLPAAEQAAVGEAVRSAPVAVQPPFETGDYSPETFLSYPSKVLVASDGSLYIADTGHHRVLELLLDPDFHRAGIKRAFGSGQAGFRDGPAGEALFDHPRGMALHGVTLFVADTGNHCLRAVDLPSGNVRTVAGTGQKGKGGFTPGAPGEIPLRSPWALLALPGQSLASEPILFIAMAGSHQIWVLLPDGRLGVFAGNGREALVDGSLHESSFNQPSDLAFGLGHLFVADAEASAVRAISLGAEQKVFTLVGMGLFEFGDVDGAGPQVRLQHPSGLAFASQDAPTGQQGSPLESGGLLYVADSYNHKIKTLDPFTGQVNSLIGTGKPGSADGSFEQAGLYEPEGVAIQGGKMYIADTNNHLIRVADLQTRKLYTLALTGMERTPVSARPAAQEGRPEALRLEPVSLAQGKTQIFFDLDLPEGYKLNSEAPVTLRQVLDGASQVYTFQPGEPVILPVLAADDRELILEMTLYYCQEEDARLCLIHDRRFALPVMVVPGALATAHVAYQVEESGPFAQPSA